MVNRKRFDTFDLMTIGVILIVPGYFLFPYTIGRCLFMIGILVYLFGFIANVLRK